MDLLWRFLVGGAIVSLFALLGDVARPKRFAGIFSGAPSVALVTLALTAAKSGPAIAALEARNDPRQPRLRAVRLRRTTAARHRTLVAIAGFAGRSRHLGSGRSRCGTVAASSRVMPSVDFSSLRDARWHQFMVRFILGGTVTLCTGLIAQHWGPVIGGLFLAFPAIFPATVTLVARHETEKKRKAGINCRARG
jgi:uncharacterized membrane protein (GlpM family)